MQQPESLTEACRLANTVDTISHSWRSYELPYSAPKLPPPPPTMNVSPSIVEGPIPMELDAIRTGRLTQQDKEELRRAGRCFYCRMPGHIVRDCPRKTRMIASIRTTGRVEEKEKRQSGISYISSTHRIKQPTPTLPRKIEDNDSSEGISRSNLPRNETVIAVNTVESKYSQNLLSFKGTLAGKPVKVLIDSGSMGNFVDPRIVEQRRLKTVGTSPQEISFANGGKGLCDKEVKAALELGNYKQNINLKVADLSGHDVILGKPWLEIFNPSIDWVKNSIRFTFNGCDITIEKPRKPENSKLELNTTSGTPEKKIFTDKPPNRYSPSRLMDNGGKLIADLGPTSRATLGLRRYLRRQALKNEVGYLGSILTYGSVSEKYSEQTGGQRRGRRFLRGRMM